MPYKCFYAIEVDYVVFGVELADIYNGMGGGTNHNREGSEVEASLWKGRDHCHGPSHRSPDLNTNSPKFESAGSTFRDCQGMHI